MTAAPRAQTGLPLDDLEVVGHRLGERVRDVRPTQWGWASPSAVVRFASGNQVVIQRRPSAEAERIATAIDAFGAAGVPVPPLLERIRTGADELIVFGHVPGRAGAAHLDGPRGDATAHRMGQELAKVRAVSANTMPAEQAWTGPTALAESIAGWVIDAEVEPRLSALAATACEIVCAVPWSSVTSHGDFVPVNALFDGDALTAILDLGDVALRHPLVDPAWWCLIVFHHHPAIATERRKTFLAAAGVRAPDRHLASVAVLRSLQLAANIRGPRRPAAAALVRTALSALAGDATG